MATPIALGSDDKSVMRLLGRLKARALRACRNHHDAEDAASQTILEYLQANGRDAIGRPMGEGLLKSRAAGRAIDTVRGRDQDAAYLQRLRQSSILQKVEDRRLAEVSNLMLRVHQMLDELDPATRREVIRLIYKNGLSYKEVCETLKILPSDARGHVFRSMLELRRRLKAEGILDLLREEMLP